MYICPADVFSKSYDVLPSDDNPIRDLTRLDEKAESA